MNRRFQLVCTLAAAAAICSACAVSPEVEAERQAREENIQEILAAPLDPAEFGATKRCLTGNEFRNWYALDDKHIVFEGPRDKLWINTLPHRCPDLEYADTLRIRTIAGSRICQMDTFYPSEWFEWPWYRRWPWRWGSGWGTSVRCTLGEFQPVTEEQVAEINALLK